MGIWAFAQKAGVDVASRGRLALSAFAAATDDHPLKVRSGILPGGDGATVTVVGGGSMNVNVTAFRAIVQGGLNNAQGAYPVVLDADTTLTLPNGGASDALYTIAAIVEDSAYDTSGVQQARLISYKDTDGPPPGTVLPIRKINLRAGVSAGTGGLLGSDLGAVLRTYTAAAGGVLRCTSTTRPLNPPFGQLIYETDTLKILAWNAIAWDHVWGKGANPYAAKVRRNAPQSLINSTTTTLAWDAIIEDGGGMVPIVANGLKATLGGLYTISGTLALNAGNLGVMVHLGLRVNGAETQVVERDNLGSTFAPTSRNFCVTNYRLNANDVVSLGVFHTHTSPISTFDGTSGPHKTELSMIRTGG